jgi:hypothetical protein
MQAVCFGLIDDIRVIAFYDCSMALGTNCVTLFLAILVINIVIYCYYSFGDNQDEFNEEEYLR